MQLCSRVVLVRVLKITLILNLMVLILLAREKSHKIFADKLQVFTFIFVNFPVSNYGQIS